MLFNFLGRDFFNALSEKDAERFTQMLIKWLGGVVLGVPVFVFRDYLQAIVQPVCLLTIATCTRSALFTGLCNVEQSRLALDWRDYMTRRLTQEYLASRTFYQIQAGSLIDNPDQRISSDVRCGRLFQANFSASDVIPAADYTALCAPAGSLQTLHWASP